jgi:rSAM/selenodomain-associated transferase 2
MGRPIPERDSDVSDVVPAHAIAVRLSVVIPTLNEAAGIGECLRRLEDLRDRGAQIIVVDGGSADDTVEQARPLCDIVIRAPRGRASQMNAGARVAEGEILLFLHADTVLPNGADFLIRAALASDVSQPWGRFDVDIDGSAPLLRVVERAMSTRSRLTGIATGDQAIFCMREVFVGVGGFPEVPLMEDIAFSARMRRLFLPHCLRARVVTSGRRWEKHGVVRTILLMWGLRLGYAPAKAAANAISPR